MAQHQIPFDTGEEERLLGSLSVSETLWLTLGGFVSYNLGKILPPLPLPNLFAYIHYPIPLAITAIIAFVRYKDMTLLQILQAWWEFYKRKRRLTFQCINILQEERKEENS